MNSTQRTLAASGALLALSLLTGCKPDDVFVEIKNATGGTMHNVKLTLAGDDVEFDTIAPSTTTGSFHHFGGPGDLSVTYTTDAGNTYTSSGPRVTGDEKGELDVRIDGTTASFDTKFEEVKK